MTCTARTSSSPTFFVGIYWERYGWVAPDMDRLATLHSGTSAAEVVHHELRMLVEDPGGLAGARPLAAARAVLGTAASPDHE